MGSANRVLSSTVACRARRGRSCVRGGWRSEASIPSPATTTTSPAPLRNYTGTLLLSFRLEMLLFLSLVMHESFQAVSMNFPGFPFPWFTIQTPCSIITLYHTMFKCMHVLFSLYGHPSGVLRCSAFWSASLCPEVASAARKSLDISTALLTDRDILNS